MSLSRIAGSPDDEKSQNALAARIPHLMKEGNRFYKTSSISEKYFPLMIPFFQDTTGQKIYDKDKIYFGSFQGILLTVIGQYLLKLIHHRFDCRTYFVNTCYLI